MRKVLSTCLANTKKSCYTRKQQWEVRSVNIDQMFKCCIHVFKTSMLKRVFLRGVTRIVSVKKNIRFILAIAASHNTEHTSKPNQATFVSDL